MTRLLSEMPHYEQLEPYIGCICSTDGFCDPAKLFTGYLSVWTAANGNQGWLISKQRGTFTAELPKGGYVLFAPEIVKTIQPTLFGVHVGV